MKGTIKLVELVTALFLLSAAASAGAKAQLLKEMCEADDRVDAALAANDSSHVKPNDAQGSAFCNGFVVGWAQTVNGMATLGGGADLTFFSFASDFDFEQGKRVFLQYVFNHPESLSEPASGVLTEALSEKNILRKRVLPLSNTGIEIVAPKK